MSAYKAPLFYKFFAKKGNILNNLRILPTVKTVGLKFAQSYCYPENDILNAVLGFSVYVISCVAAKLECCGCKA